MEEQNGAAKLTLSAQDLRPETRYGVFMIFADGGRYAGVNVGPLAVDAKGKAEMRRSIEKTQLYGHVFNEAAAIAVMPMGTTRMEAPLCGYRNEPVAWRNGFYEKTTPIKETPPPKPEPLKPELPEPPKLKPPEPELLKPEPIKPESPEPEPPAVMVIPEEVAVTTEPVPFDEEVIPTVILPAEEEMIPTESVLSEEEKEVLSDLFPHTETVKAPVTRFNAPIDFSVMRSISPFVGGSGAGMKWARFTLNDKIIVLDDKPDLFSEAFVLASYEVYAHFILGEVSDSETPEYVIGVPGRYSAAQNTQAKKLGFDEFKCYEDIETAEDEFGYWLMFVG